MPPDVVKSESSLAYRLRLIHREASLGKVTDTDYRKAQVRDEKNDKHLRFKPRFSAGDYVLVERLHRNGIFRRPHSLQGLLQAHL